jgi:hypothetical protein
MAKRCAKCGSSNLKECSTEMAVYRGKETSPIYAAATPIYCLECGFAEFALFGSPLEQLRESSKQSNE